MATPLYNVGTATLTNGLTVMTGQGTLWLGNVRPGDQVVSYTGQTAIVGTVNSNTSITLARAFRGTSQTAQAYEILYTPDDPFTQQLAREVLQGISSSALLKLGGVTPAARKLVRFDASANAALSDLSDFALTLLDDADAAAARATLDSRWSDTGGAPPNDNLNDVAFSGIYNIGANTQNTPNGTGPLGSSVFCIVYGSTNQTQIFFQTQSGIVRVFVRRKTSSTWSSWQPIVGDRGSNPNGEYVRFADGTQLCWIPNAIFTRGANSFATYGWTFPASFASTVAVSVCLPTAAGSYTGTITPGSVGQLFRGTTLPVTVSTSLGFWRTEGAANWTSGSQITDVQLAAFGRWIA